MTPCILIAYNAFTGENCCLHALSEHVGSLSTHVYRVPELDSFTDNEWDIIAVIELDEDIGRTVPEFLDNTRGNIRIHVDEVDVTEGSRPEYE